MSSYLNDMSFEGFVGRNMISDTALRTRQAAQVITALEWANDHGRGGFLTPEERGILHCLTARAKGRADQPCDDSLARSATSGLLGWVTKILLDDPLFAADHPEWRELIARFREDEIALLQRLNAESRAAERQECADEDTCPPTKEPPCS